MTPPFRFKWTRPFRRKTKFGFCACAITFQTQSNFDVRPLFCLRFYGRVETESDGTRRSTGGEVKGKEANGVGSQHSCTVRRNTAYPALLPLMRTPRLPAAD